MYFFSKKERSCLLLIKRKINIGPSVQASFKPTRLGFVVVDP